MDTPPERLVTTGPFALSRNPMYLGHVIFLAGLALSLRSWPGTAIALGAAAWLQFESCATKGASRSASARTTCSIVCG